MSGGLAEKLEDRDTQQRAGVAVQGKTARDLVLEMEPQFRRALPAHVDAGRFTRLALTALRSVPRLAECSGESILAGLMQAAHLGLEIDAVRGQAYLVPRWNNKTKRMEATFQLGYKGLIDLAGRGDITVRARDVRENDLFEHEDGLDLKLRHVPELKRDRGDAWAYFAVATFPNGAREALVMSRSEIERHRDRFASTKNKQGVIVGPWVEHFDAMARKTVIRGLLNQMPLPVEVVEALSMEDVPIDVGAVDAIADPALPPAPPEDEPTRPAEQGRSGGTPPAATNESDDQESLPDVPPPAATDEVERAAVELEQRRELAAYMLDEARKANAGVKAFRDANGIPVNPTQWTREHIDAVIEWITAEPAEPQEATP